MFYVSERRASAWLAVTLVAALAVHAATGEVQKVLAGERELFQISGAGCVCDNPMEMCDTTGTCVHKDLTPFAMQDYVGAILGALACMLCSGGGLGGGGLFVPLLILIYGFDPHVAIPLSKAMIFGGALANLSINFWDRHPEADRPLIDYDAVLMLEPMTLGGTTVGVLLNVMMPSWLVLVLLVILLTLTTYRTMQKGIQEWKKESESTKKKIDEEDIASQVMNALDTQKDGLGDGNRRRTADDEAVLKEILSLESEIPWRKLMIVGLTWVIVFACSFAKGGHGAPSLLGIENCSGGYWLITFIVFAVTIGSTLYVGLELREMHEIKAKVGYKYLEGDIQWDDRNTKVIPWVSFIAGVAAGLMGIGGGMIKGPLLTELGVGPMKMAATSATMIAFTSSSTTIQFAVLGLVPFGYGMFVAILGFVFTYIGKIVIVAVVKKYNRASIILLCVAITIGLSTVFLAGIGFVNVVDDLRMGRRMGFQSMCS